MSSDESSLARENRSRKYDANETLAQIYRQAHPQIHLRTGYTLDEWPAAITKVKLGLETLVNLCKLELKEQEFQSDSTPLTPNYSEEYELRPIFAEGSSLGYEVCNDAAWLMTLMMQTNVYDEVDYEAILAPLYEFFKICLDTHSGAGDMYLRICSALHIGTVIYESYELEITRDVIRRKISGHEFSERWLLGILNDLDETIKEERSENQDVIAVRFYDKDYVIAYATSEFVQFDELDLHMENKNRYNDDYVHGQVYRNDKVFPNSAQEWLNITLPENKDSIILGTRYYSSIDEAEESEREFMNWLQALLDD